MKTNIKSIFDELIKYDSNIRKKVEPYQSKYEKYIILGMIVSFAIAFILALYVQYDNQSYWIKIVSLGLLTVSLLLTLFYELIYIYRGFEIFKEGVIKPFLESRIKISSEDYDFATSLMKFNNEELFYVKKYLLLEMEHLKKRISLLIGPIDKIGIIPALVSLSFLIYKNIEETTHLYDMFDWLSYGIIGIFIIGIIALSNIPKIERYILLLETTINLTRSTSSEVECI